MSARFLVPTGWACDTYGCDRTAMGHTPFKLSEKGKLELDSYATTGLPEGWTHVNYTGDLCPSHSAKDAARKAASAAVESAAAESIKNRQARADARAREAEQARKLREQADAATKSTKRLCDGCKQFGSCCAHLADCVLDA